MPFRLIPSASACLLRLIVITATCLSVAHAQQEQPQQPGLFESLGKLLQPKQDAPAVEAANPSRNLAVAGKERRVALVIGNSAYPGAGALRNPANDANDIAAKLKKLGFDVTVRTDMRHKEMLRSLTDFGDKVQTGTEALFFYAGHGMQVRGKNYLLPVDAEIRNEASASSEAVDVDQLLDKLSLARLSVVILDACRNNPFERRFRGSGQGLAQINAPTGTLIAYATAPGKVAADGDGRNGLYTAELLTAMDIPGIKIEDVFKRVRGNVVKKSNDAQTPWESSSLTGDFYFTFQGPTTVNVQQAPARARTPEEIEDSHWDDIKDSREIVGFEEYLKQYPTGRYAAQARSKLAKLKAEARQPEKTPVVVAPPPAQVPVSSTPDDPEAAMWNEVKASGAREYLDAYLKQYPKGKYVALAKIELKKLDERDKAQRAKESTEKQQAAERERQEALRVEQAAWDGAKATGSAAAYASYLERYPKGRYAALAQAVLPKLQREEAEKEKREAAERKLVAERERREAEERARQEAARVAEEQRKAREEAARVDPSGWALADNGADINWNEATQYCASKGSGWRLPTVAELQINYHSGQPTSCGSYRCKVASKSRLTGPTFWTNESKGFADAWSVYLTDGDRYTLTVGDRGGDRALCIRRP
jgi:outer membrane protein assembly factor BamD (BamD/ComL family)